MAPRPPRQVGAPDASRALVVERANADDLVDILAWLKAEHRHDRGIGFWCNRRIIKEALKLGDLWVIRRDDEAVAFQVGNHAADIACVRQDWQRRGLGKALAEASVARAYEDDVNVLAGECEPRTSLPFWISQGFERYGPMGDRDRILVRRVLERRYALPAGNPLVHVVVGFYPEAVTYGRMLPPIVEHELRGAVLEDGTVLLERRVVGLCDDEPERKDLAVRIQVDSVERCFGKAKHDAAVATGVRRGRDYASFHVDRVKPPVD